MRPSRAVLLPYIMQEDEIPITGYRRFDQICSLVLHFDFEAIGMSKTWFHPGTPSENYQIPGYTPLRCDRKLTNRVLQPEMTYRGVALYTKEEVTFDQGGRKTERS
ncbi:hypothetical protein J6590_036267 [Homalodisca vitripennis]|nr:hypothetical protein J6590_036267 [Homalodisca vitripennis]